MEPVNNQQGDFVAADMGAESAKDCGDASDDESKFNEADET